jgi:hypothetical protein
MRQEQSPYVEGKALRAIFERWELRYVVASGALADRGGI